MKNKKGFTLIELLIVIALIAILAAAIVVGINPARNFRNARNSTRWAQMNAIATAIYSYAVENDGAYPSYGGDLHSCIGTTTEPLTIATTTATTTWCHDGTDNLIVPDYLRTFPTPPLADNGEVYLIEFSDSQEEAIKITSSATEAQEDGVELVQ